MEDAFRLRDRLTTTEEETLLRRSVRRFFGIEPPYEFLSSIAIGWPGAEPGEAVGHQADAIDWYENGGRKTVD